ncbi:hypothetical protein ACFPRL_07190 [Pseudoclavibacter helvolus]
MPGLTAMVFLSECARAPRIVFTATPRPALGRRTSVTPACR